MALAGTKQSSIFNYSEKSDLWFAFKEISGGLRIYSGDFLVELGPCRLLIYRFDFYASTVFSQHIFKVTSLYEQHFLIELQFVDGISFFFLL